MKILFCGFKYEYGQPERGLSVIEYQNFFGTLKLMQGVDATFFAVDEILKKEGRERMNQLLIQTVQEQKPDLLFCMLFTEEIKKDTISYITKKTSTKTFNWFTDDHWRLPVYSRYWAPLFTAVGTTDSEAPEKYRKLGINNVIKTQWAANTFMYKPQSAVGRQQTADSYNVTFVGKNYGKRSKFINELKNHGLPAMGFGNGWESGTVDFNKMLEIFSGSKINLNFTESYFSWPKQLAKLFLVKHGKSYGLNRHPFGQFESLQGAFRRQIKARTFEIPACRGFMITGNADNLKDYYILEKEIVVWQGFDELLEKCQYYLSHEQERAQIAEAGYQRTVREHTYDLRFKEIFKKLELL